MKLSTFETLKDIRPPDSFTLTDEQLRRLQEVLSSMLSDIMTLAEDNDIALSLGGGTALGALRHGGFIPWDDDIDLNIERKDYDRFLRLLQDQRESRYWIHTPETTHDYGLLFTRIRLKGTDVRQREDAYGDECGATIDLFPIENAYDFPPLRVLHGIACLGSAFLLSCRKFFRDRAIMRTYLDAAPALRTPYYIKTVLGFLTAWGSVDFWTRVTSRIYSLCRNDASRYVVIPTGRGHFFGETYLRETFCRYATLPFDGRQYNCTADIDAYMTRLYGNYHRLPDADARERHAYFSFDLP